jgi:hypothetical protein
LRCAQLGSPGGFGAGYGSAAGGAGSSFSMIRRSPPHHG